MLDQETWRRLGASEVYELIPGRAYEVIFDLVVTRVWIAPNVLIPANGFHALYDELIEVGGRRAWVRAEVPHATDAEADACLREALIWLRANLKKRGLVEN